MMQIPCMFGTIYPHGGEMLAVDADHHPKAVRALATLEGVRCWQDGDRETTFIFPLTLFDRVAGVIRPKRRRRLSPEQRARLAAHGFARAKTGSSAQVVDA